MPLTRRQYWDLGWFVLLLSIFIGSLTRESGLETRRYPAIDLLELVRPELQPVDGKWARDGTALISPAIPWARLQIPYIPPEEYDLQISVLRVSGLDSFNLGLSDGEHQFMIILDGDVGSASWIDRIDPRSRGGGVSRYSNKTFLQQDALIALDVSVRKHGVTVSANHRQIINWKGDIASLTLAGNWKVPQTKVLFVGAYESSYRIERFSVLPVSGEGTIVR